MNLLQVQQHQGGQDHLQGQGFAAADLERNRRVCYATFVSDFDDTDDIFVGYRYFETMSPECVRYPFGYGLSYTEFRMSNPVVFENDDKIIATVEVLNDGERAGREVVQLYYSAPQGVLGKPAVELGAYKMESTFKAGKYIRQKCYVEIGYDDKVNSTIAGLPKKLGKYINLDNFKIGFSILKDDPAYTDKKLTFVHVKGGVLLVPTDFTIKG